MPKRRIFATTLRRVISQNSCNIRENTVYKRALQAIAKASVNLVVSVRLSALNNSSPTGRVFTKLKYLRILLNLSTVPAYKSIAGQEKVVQGHSLAGNNCARAYLCRE
jgi:hypothetical protein